MVFTIMSKNKRTIILLTLVILAIVVALSVVVNYKDYVLADKKELKSYANQLETEYVNFTTTNDLKEYIVNWADTEGLTYKVDKYDNIIFRHKASESNKDIPTTVVCVSYNLFTTEKNMYAISMAQYLAKYGLHDTNANIIFINNVNNLNEGAKHISSKYFPAGSNVIYLDSAKSTFISRQSFTQTMTEISVPFEAVPSKCDTRVTISINGIKPDLPGGSIKNQPNPISTLNSILTKLKSKALAFQIADIKVANNGNLYPSGIDITILINSYSIETVTKYLDKKAEDYTEDFIDDFPDISFTYEISGDPADIPAEAYSDDTTNYLYNLIYTVKNGSYRFKEDEAPDGFEENQIYGINCYENIAPVDDRLVLTVNTSALSSTYLEKIMKDNNTAASLSNAEVVTRGTAPEFFNASESLANSLVLSYDKVNDLTSKEAVIKTKTDSSFTPCSFFVTKNRDLDTIHLCANKTSYYKLTNAIMNVTTYDKKPWE